MENSQLDSAYTDRMKCPIVGRLVNQENGIITSFVFACQGALCGIWDDEKHCCSVKVIALEMTRIQQKMTAFEGDKGGLN